MTRTYILIAASALAVALTVAFATTQKPVLQAQATACNMSGYTSADGLTATAEGDGVTIAWAGDQGADLRMRLAIEGGTPVVRELAARRKG